MKMRYHGDGGPVCEILEPGVILSSVEEALDLMAEADSRAILLSKEQITPAFFDLSTRLLGAILQKYTTYGISLAVWGDFSGGSESLQDFIRESNRGGRFLFLESREDALAALLGAYSLGNPKA